MAPPFALSSLLTDGKREAGFQGLVWRGEGGREDSAEQMKGQQNINSNSNSMEGKKEGKKEGWREEVRTLQSNERATEDKEIGSSRSKRHGCKGKCTLNVYMNIQILLVLLSEEKIQPVKRP